MNKILFLDFDGTIITSVISEYILNKFIGDEWRSYHDLFIEHKITLEEMIIAEYSMIKTPIDKILKEIDDKIVVRENFKNLLTYAKKNSIQIQIVSGGMDFVIQHLLKKLGIQSDIKIVSVKMKQHKNMTMEVLPPERYDRTIKDFKRDHVNHFKKQNYYVYFAGDSPSDYEAATEADMVFSVKGSLLTSFCEEIDKEVLEFTDFKEIMSYLE